MCHNQRKCRYCGRCYYFYFTCYCYETRQSCDQRQCRCQVCRGDRGPQGIQGVTGPTGIQGWTGPTGPKGDDGVAVMLLDTYNSYEALKSAHPTGSAGDMYLVDGDTYVWSESEQDWVNAGQIKGAQGEAGATGATGALDTTIPLLYAFDSTGEISPLYVGDTLPLPAFKTVHQKYEGSNGSGTSLIEWTIETLTIDLNDRVSLISIFGTVTLADFGGRGHTFTIINTTDEPRFKRFVGRVDKHAENIGVGDMNMLLYYYDENGMTLTDQLALAAGPDLVFNFQDMLILSEFEEGTS